MKYKPRVLFALTFAFFAIAAITLLSGDVVSAAAHGDRVSSFNSAGSNQSRSSSATILTSSLQVLHSFAGPDGGSPNALIEAADGPLYGSAANGGDVTSCPSDGCGTLFKSDGSGNFTLLHVFHASDGYLPTGLVQAKDGNLYGTTMSGGQPSGGGAGILFRMDAAGSMTVLYRFVGGFACCDGAGPSGPPIQANDGKFYGVTGGGGAFRDIDHQGGFGTIYRFDPDTSTLTILHSFNLADGIGIFPNGPLVQATDGFFYGTTREGGGGVFKMDTAGNLTLLHRITDSGEPLAGLIQASDGFLYGTTDGPPGTVFRVDLAGNYSVVNRFDGGDGYGLNHGVLQASDGLFYGTAPEGGLLDFQGGDLFRLDVNGTVNILHSFSTTDGTGGYIPNSQLIQGADGAIYGMAGIGGINRRGTIFRFDPRVPGPVDSIDVRPGTVVSTGTATGKVTLSSPAPAGGTVVNLGAGAGQIVIPTTVKVHAGAKTATFKIRTLSIGAKVDVRIYASVAGQGVRTIITVLPAPHLSSFALVPASVLGGGTAVGTIKLTSPAPSNGAIITLASNSTKAIVPAKVQVHGGATSLSFVVKTQPVAATLAVTIFVIYNGDMLSGKLIILH